MSSVTSRTGVRIACARSCPSVSTISGRDTLPGRRSSKLRCRPIALRGDSSGGDRNGASRNEPLAYEINANVETPERVRPEQHHVTRFGEHDDVRGRGAAGIDVSEADGAVDLAAIRCHESHDPSRLEAE